MSSGSSARISPTAHYTAFVWYRNGLSHPALATAQGRAMYRALAPLDRLSERRNGGLGLERFLLQRHRIIDHRLEVALSEGRVGQVLEIACGLSPRGLRVTARRPAVRYVEADLPAMARNKAALLSEHGLWGRDHRVVSVDALSDEGPDALAAVAARELVPGVAAAVITEGLVNYFDAPTVDAMWARIARVLRAQGGGVYLSDIHLTAHAPQGALARTFRAGLGLFARGRTHYGHRDEDDAGSALRQAGFDDVRFHRPREYAASLGVPQTTIPDVQRVVEAWVGEAPPAA
jgi:O-methyltransferase involved in polyketide biosynthesis